MTPKPMQSQPDSAAPRFNYFWLRWAVAIFLGGFLFGDMGVRVATNYTLLIGMIGLGISIGQWLILKPYIANAPRWFLLTLSSTLLAGLCVDINFPLQMVSLVLQFIPSATGYTWPLTVVVSLVSWLGFLLCMSAGQWFVLRPIGQHANWWPVANTIGGSIAVLLGIVLLWGRPVSSAILLGSGLYGAMTGPVMEWILRRNVSALER